MLKQVSIFLENKAGRVYSIMETLAEAQINVRAMTIAETAEFGIVRIIVCDPERAKSVLRENNFTVKTTEVVGVTIPDKFGALCDVLRLFSQNNINIEYSYSLMGCTHGNANILIRVNEPEKAELILSNAGVKLITPDEIV